MADAIAKFWIMPRTGTALEPVDSTAPGVTATKGFDLSRDFIGGRRELEYVATAVRDQQSFDVRFRNNRAPHSATGAVGAGTVFSGSIIDARQRRAVARRDRIRHGRYRHLRRAVRQPQDDPCRTELAVSADRACDLTNVYGNRARNRARPELNGRSSLERCVGGGLVTTTTGREIERVPYSAIA